ncbi:MAG: DUF484 family protein [Mariprofundaceae bacterium]
MSQNSSVVTDLTGRRVEQLVKENHDLKQYISEVMTRLNENESLFSRLFALEAQVLGASDSEDLCFTLLRGLRSGFSLDMVRIWFDRSSFMGGCELGGISEADLVWVEKGEIAQMGLCQKSVWLLKLDHKHDFPWLEKKDEHLASMALLVLGDLSRPFGVLAMGSVDRTRFSSDHGSDFLQHLGHIVGLTLENATARERLARLSVTDGLTGAHNRRFFQPHSHQPLSQWFGTGIAVACLYFDVDDFKIVNDRFGHAAGDELLQQLSQTVRRSVRSQDILVRMGGDEFAVFLPACSFEKAQEIAERMVRDCAAVRIEDESISISMGLAYATGEAGGLVNRLVEEADQAMYIAKALGGSRVEVALRDEQAT